MPETQKRVLIVDDEEDLTWTLSKKLSKDSDKFEVTCVNSGKEAMGFLNQVPFDLVITDVRMPEVSGLDLLVNIKNLYPATKVVIMTAYGSSDVQAEANERGCFNYIEKPFEINELRQLIIDALEQRKGFKGNVADFQLSDIIQLHCLGRLTSALSVECEDGKGTIFFQEGNIIHAETRKLEGEHAFYHILSWQGGEFQVLRNHVPSRETITKNWQSLLLESMRRVDENSDLAKEVEEEKKQKRQQEIHQILKKFRKADNIEHVLLHTKVGFPLFYEGIFDGKLEKISDLGNFISLLWESVIKTSKFLEGGGFQFWEIQFNSQTSILQKIPVEDAYLTIIGKSPINSGFIRLELKKKLPELTKYL